MTAMRTRNLFARAARGLAVAVAGVVLALFAYAAAGLIGGAIPANADWRAPDASVPGGSVRIYVESNGIHTGIVVPKVAAGIDWRPLLKPEHLRDPRYAGFDHASFGWGEAKFYVETPTWWDLRPGTVLAAMFGSDHTLMHVDHVPAPKVGADVRTLVLTPAQYRRLAAYIRASFAEQAAHRVGYWQNDAFYTGRGRYSAVQTCNAWTGDALRHAGVRVGAWTPFPATVLWWF